MLISRSARSPTWAPQYEPSPREVYASRFSYLLEGEGVGVPPSNDLSNTNVSDSVGSSIVSLPPGMEKRMVKSAAGKLPEPNVAEPKGSTSRVHKMDVPPSSG